MGKWLYKCVCCGSSSSLTCIRLTYIWLSSSFLSALSSAPLFLAKLPVGFLSGVLLQRYCPEHVEEGEVRHSKTMWMIIGLSTVVSPIMITILWGYISGSDTKASISNGRNNEETEDTNSSENSYQHQPLTHQISLPRVRSQEERPLL